MSMAVCFGAFALTMYLGQSMGQRKGAWMGWILAMVIFPAWMIKWVGPISLDPRMCAGGAAILLFLTSGDEIKIKVTLMDVLFFGFFAVNILSQNANNDLTAGTACAFFRRWMIPYFVGRFFFTKHEQIDEVVPIFAKLLLLVSIMAIIEAVTQKNWVNVALGKSFYILDQTSEGFRWGMKRAHGCTEHPIYFGLMMVMLFPWAIEAGRAAWQKRGPQWWLAVPPTMFAAIVVTVSRGAQIASVICMVVAVFFRCPKLRAMILIGGIALGLGKDVLQDKAMEVLSKAAGEEQHEEKWVPINGEEYLYTGTRHRMLLFVAYERGIQNAGWFGYGAAMKKVPVYEDAAERFSSIDCHYLVLLLQHGWGGIYTFCGMLAVSIFYAALAAWKVDSWNARITSALCGSMISVGMLMMSAFFHPHYGGVFMFCCGLLACIHSMPRAIYPGGIANPDKLPTAVPDEADVADEAGDRPDDPSSSANESRPLLIPGHAPIRNPDRLQINP